MTTLIMKNDLNESLHQPVLVRALPNYRVYLEFSNGEKGTVDLSDLAGRGVFEVWNNYSAFERVHVSGHRAIEWNDHVELCADMLYLRMTGKSPRDLFGLPTSL
jgi:Protein of unknown function (DUF2442)